MLTLMLTLEYALLVMLVVVFIRRGVLNYTWPSLLAVNLLALLLTPVVM